MTIDRIGAGVRYLPTVNLLDITSLYSWVKMRTISKDYGKKFFKRNEILISVLFVYMVVIFLLFTIVYLGRLPLLSKEQEIVFMFILFYDFVIFLVLILSVFFNSARFNNYYDAHIYRLAKIRALLKEIHTF